MSKKGGKCKSARYGKKFAVAGGRLNLLRKLYFDFVKVIFWLLPKLYFGFQPKLRYLSITCPQGKYHCNAISLRKQYHCRRQYHCVSKFPERETNSLTSRGFSGILALRVSRTVASQDEESPSITRQGAGEIPVKATSRKVQQRYTARFIV